MKKLLALILKNINIVIFTLKSNFKMKTKINLFLVITLVGLNSWGQVSNNNLQSTFEVNQLLICKWNTNDGIPYSQVPGANIGATSFEVIENNKIAFLCNSTSEIIVINTIDGKKTNKFPVIFAPRDFVYDNGLFYVLSEKQVIVYDSNGKENNKFSFPDKYIGTERMTRFNNSTYLLLPSGNSLKIESNGNSIVPIEYNGLITSSGKYIKTQLKGESAYSISVVLINGKTCIKEFYSENKIAGVYVVGSTNNRIVLDVQTYISENPISVERKIVSIEITNTGLGNIIAEIKIPDVYYVLSNKEFSLLTNGILYNMITSPDGVSIFSLTETKKSTNNNGNGYPKALIDKNYHFNDNLLKVEE